MKNPNSVCFISKVLEIIPIEGADKIELVKVNGWTSIISKNSINIGDLVLCITTDAVIPNELAEHWGVSNYLRKGGRVRTVKLKGVYSECILVDIKNRNIELNEGDDMMGVFKIYKYEPPEITTQFSYKNGNPVKIKPSNKFKVYHKFPNIKNGDEMFVGDDMVKVTRKYHGTNARYGVIKKDKLSILEKVKKFLGFKVNQWEFVYGSHNVQKNDSNIERSYYSEDIWGSIAISYELDKVLMSIVNSKSNPNIPINDSIIIYGEIIGAGIQGEYYTYGLGAKYFKLFDIMVDGRYLSDPEVQQLNYWMKLPQVDVLEITRYKDLDLNKYINDTFINKIKGRIVNVPHEGVVIAHPSGDRSKIAKWINPNYLIHAEKMEVPDGH